MNPSIDFKNREHCRALISQIKKESTKQAVIMEVCGGHTMALYRNGITALLPETIRMVSGPGCPVCVSDIRYIDHAIALAKRPDVIIATYGDLIRVPGSTSSLEKEKASGAAIIIVWSGLEAVDIAVRNPDKKVVFLGIGFETTIPGTAIAVMEARKKKVENFFALCSHKIMPPAMTALIDEGVRIDAYLCPGHVSTVTGSAIYEPIVSNYGKPCVVAGFEPADILQSILMIVRQIEAGQPAVEIQYTRVVHREGNPKAQSLINEVFTPADDWWRGLGVIPGSGLRLSDDYKKYDAAVMVPVTVEPTREAKGCICGSILKGLKYPADCPLFAKACTPDSPVGACMVSSEGACAAFYQYGEYASGV
ncbi:MAG: hydrogenase formation protein HypD [Chitinispirillaceae bacterium]|nr:hydrogenase formation protein HypD [Chitinispirillaceae bacterium]